MRSHVVVSMFAVSSALLLAGCGSSPSAPADSAAGQPGARPVVESSADPAALPAKAPVSPGTECGMVTAFGTIKAKIVVREGAVDCGQANDLLTHYFHGLTPADIAKPDGAGPISVGRWTCGSGPIPTSSDVATCSTEDGREVDGVSPS